MTDKTEPSAGKAGTPNFMRQRFYSDVRRVETPSGFVIQLDGRSVRTPGRSELVLPTGVLAEAIADEWRAHDTFIDPTRMPLTRFGNTTIDGVIPRIAEVRADAAKYAGTDLLCYRADGPAALVERQERAWDPVLLGVEAGLGASFTIVRGIMPIPQPTETLDRVAAWFSEQDAFAVTALHVMTTITGSAVLAIAFAKGDLDIEVVWRLALVDEDYQMELWGRDDEAMKVRERRWLDIEAAARFLSLSRG